MPVIQDKLLIHIPFTGAEYIKVKNSDTFSYNNLDLNLEKLRGRKLDTKSKYYVDINYLPVKGIQLDYLTAQEINEYDNTLLTTYPSFVLVRNPINRYIKMLANKIKPFADLYEINQEPLFIDEFKQPSYVKQELRPMYEFIYHCDSQKKLVNNIFREEDDTLREWLDDENIIIEKEEDLTINKYLFTLHHLHKIYDTFFEDFNLFGYLNEEIITHYLTRITEPDIIITIVDQDTLSVFEIFYEYFEKHHKKNLLVISLDDFTFLKINEKKIFTLLLPIKNNIFHIQPNFEVNDQNPYDLELKKYKYYLVSIIFYLSRKNIIYTDPRCIWFQDITLSTAFQNNNYDFISGLEFDYTSPNIEKYGFSFSQGLFKINYTSRSYYLLEEIKNKNYQIEIPKDLNMIDNFIYHEANNIQHSNLGRIITLNRIPHKFLMVYGSDFSRIPQKCKVYYPMMDDIMRLEFKEERDKEEDKDIETNDSNLIQETCDEKQNKNKDLLEKIDYINKFYINPE